MKSKDFLVILILLFSSNCTASEGPSWKLALKKNNISVYTSPVKGSSFNEFKGVTIINEPLDVILFVLQDVGAYTQWMSDCSAAYVIEKINDIDNVVYFSQKLPWPVRDRDVVTRTDTHDNLENKEYIILFSSLSRDDTPPKKGFIRMASMKGHWKLTYIDKDNTEVEYQIKADPSGSIPSTIANMTSKKIPYETLFGLTKMARKQTYLDRSHGSELRKRINKLIFEGKL